MKQRTVSRVATVDGIGVNSGEPVKLTLRPAPAGTGIVFRRIDLEGHPEISASVMSTFSLMRKTALSAGTAEVHLVEHVMSALNGCGIDNVFVELTAPEVPILDGSAKPFVDLIAKAGYTEQTSERVYFEVRRPIFATQGSATIIALPAPDFRISCTVFDDRAPNHAQHLALTIEDDVYIREIAPARTYILYDVATALRSAGGVLGGSFDNCLVINGDDYMSSEPLRFKDEIVRHKMLDIIGDTMLLGVRLKAHIIAMRASHSLNATFTKELRLQALEHGVLRL